MGGAPGSEWGLTGLRRLICEMGGLNLPLGVVTMREGVWVPLGCSCVLALPSNHVAPGDRFPGWLRL